MPSPAHSWKQWTLLGIFFFLIANVITSSAFVTSGLLPGMADIINHLAAIIQAKVEFTEHQFPLRTAPLLSEGWPYPFYQFYSPTTYTFLGFINYWLTPSDTMLTYHLGLELALVLGGLFMYRLAYGLIESSPAALIASITYLTAPYLLILINHLAALNETIAMGILPAVIYYTLQRYYYPEQHKTLLQIGLAWYFLATIHLLTFFYTSLFVGLFLILLTLQQKKKWINLVDTGIGFLFGCGLAAWYLLPITSLQRYLIIGNSFKSGLYLSSSLGSLLSPSVNISGGMTVNHLTVLPSALHPNLGLPIVLGIVFCFYALFSKQFFFPLSSMTRIWLKSLLCLFLIAFIMAWTPINFWQWLPSCFSAVQYSSRLLIQTAWTGALLTGFAIYWLYKGKISVPQLILTILFLLLATKDWLPITELDMRDFKRDLNPPHLIFMPQAYLIDPINYLKSTSVIDNILLKAFLDEFGKSSLLRFNTEVGISQQLINLAISPVLVLRAHIPATANHHQLALFINKKKVATHELKPGLLNWEIPLKKNTRLSKTEPPLAFQFKLLPTLNPIPKINVNDLLLTGFLRPGKVLTLNQIKPYCSQQKTITTCTLTIPKQIRIVELPAYYYPELLDIHLNGHRIHYFNILYRDLQIPAIIPLPGEKNTIQIEFRGLPAANFISQIMWGFGLLILIYLGIKRKK